MEKIRDFCKRHEPKIVLLISVILVGLVGFEAGYWQGKEVGSKPIIIEKPSQGPENASEEAKNSGMVKDPTPTSRKASEGDLKGSQIAKCAFVGSKNSTKFHTPNCQWAKRIKPENLVCFDSLETALKAGRTPDKGCIK